MSDPCGFRFQVFGKVQGVFFRNYTQKKATQLKVVGWIRNTSRGTVEGEVASKNRQACHQMKVWLQSEGSPHSGIDHAEFSNLDSEALQALLKVGSFDVYKTSRR